MVRYRAMNIAFHEPDDDVVRSAEARGALSDRVEHRLGVGGRAADDAQNLRCRRLLLERFLRLVEQPHVLDRDHRLGGERFEELDLFIGERRTSSRRMRITPIAVSSRSSGTARKDRSRDTASSDTPPARALRPHRGHAPSERRALRGGRWIHV